MVYLRTGIDACYNEKKHKIVGGLKNEKQAAGQRNIIICVVFL